MNSAEAREYVRLATTETKGRTKTACDLLIDESIKLEKIKEICNQYCDAFSTQGIEKIKEVVNGK